MANKTPAEVLLQRGRIGRFLSVGVLGALVETVVVAVLTVFFGVGALVAKAGGAEISITMMFFVNDRWTFAEDGDDSIIPTIRRWGRSHTVRVVGLSVAFSVLYALTALTSISIGFAGIELWPTLANGIGIVCGMVVNYVAESVFTWDILSETSSDI